MSIRTNALTVCLLLLLAATACTAAPRAPGPTAAGDLQALAVSNQGLARQETQRLAGLAQLPPGATPVASGPSALSGPTMGTPATDSLIDTTHYFTVPLSLDLAVSWMNTHRPAGLEPSGGSGGPESPNLSRGVAYRAPDSAAWTQAQLEIGVFPVDSGSTAWRVDGLAQWWDPRPTPDVTPDAQRMSMTIAGGCPAGDEGKAGVTPTDAGTTVLLPDLAPTAGLVCNYSDGNGKGPGLQSHRLLDAQAAGRLAKAANAMGLRHQDGLLSTCGSTGDGVSAYVLAFSYAGRVDATLWFAPEGCPTVSNGTVVAVKLSAEFYDLVRAG